MRENEATTQWLFSCQLDRRVSSENKVLACSSSSRQQQQPFLALTSFNSLMSVSVGKHKPQRHWKHNDNPKTWKKTDDPKTQELRHYPKQSKTWQIVATSWSGSKSCQKTKRQQKERKTFGFHATQHFPTEQQQPSECE